MATPIRGLAGRRLNRDVQSCGDREIEPGVKVTKIRRHYAAVELGCRKQDQNVRQVVPWAKVTFQSDAP